MKLIRGPFGSYAVALALVFAALLFRITIEKLIGAKLPTYITFYPAIMYTALSVGLGPGLLATAATAILVDYFVITPYVFGNWTLESAVSMFLFTGMGIFMSLIAHRYRHIRDRLEVLVAERTEELNRANTALQKQIKESHISEKALAEERVILDTIMSSTDVMLVLLDTDFNFIAVNKAYAESCRMKPEEIIGKNHFFLYPSEENEAIFCSVRDSGEPVFYKDKPFEYPDQPERGPTYWDWSLTAVKGADAVVKGLVFSLRETTPYVHVQTALQLSEERSRELVVDVMEAGRKSENMSAEFDTVFSSIQDAVLIYDTGMNVRKVNRSFFEYYGFDPIGLNVSELIERTGCCLIDGRPMVLAEQPTPRALQGETILNQQFRVTRDNGEEAIFETSSTPLRIDGRIQGIVTVWHDITAHKRAEELLQQLNEQLEAEVAERTNDLLKTVETLQSEVIAHQQAEEELVKQKHLLIQKSRHAAMGEMIGNIAHQWRQPLNTLGLFTQRLGLFYGSPDFNKEFLDTSVAKSMEIIQYMSRTIDDFRNFFSTEREKTEFRVDEALCKAQSLVEASFKDRRIRVEKEACDEVVIYGFPNEYAQVLLNILMNAKDALVEREVKNPRVWVTVGTENGTSLVIIADNAGGISDDIIDDIFDPYFTTKGPQQGTGVGLFMSKAIIEKNMGGRLTVRNTDVGAEFRIEV